MWGKKDDDVPNQMDKALAHMIEGAGAVLFQVWNTLDVDRDGQLSKEEFQQVTHKLGVHWDINVVPTPANICVINGPKTGAN